MDFKFTNKNLPKIMLAISMIVLLWIGTFGLLYHIDGMNLEGNKSSCLFGSQKKECVMNFSEHINIWQEMFTLIPQNILEFTNTLILFMTLGLIFIFWKNYFYIFYEEIILKFSLYLREHPQIKLFNHLGEIFSSGILNTKIYKTATI